MVTVQFQAKVKNGTILIPRKYQGKLGDQVRVILKVDAKKISTHGYLDSLMENPVKVKNFKILSRNEIYVR